MLRKATRESAPEESAQPIKPPPSFRLFLPEGGDIAEHGYFTYAEVVALLRKYKGQPEAIQYLADMME